MERRVAETTVRDVAPQAYGARDRRPQAGMRRAVVAMSVCELAMAMACAFERGVWLVSREACVQRARWREHFFAFAGRGRAPQASGVNRERRSWLEMSRLAPLSGSICAE